MGSNLIKPDPGLIILTLITFSLVALVLARYAWKPILAIIEAREKSIREALEESKRARTAADEALAKNKELVTQARAEAARIVAEGQKEAEKVRSEILEKARGETQALLAQGRRQIEQETRQAVADLKGTVVEVALDAAAKLIQTTLDEPRHRKLVEQYVDELPKLKSTSA